MWRFAARAAGLADSATGPPQGKTLERHVDVQEVCLESFEGLEGDVSECVSEGVGSWVWASLPWTRSSPW